MSLACQCQSCGDRTIFWRRDCDISAPGKHGPAPGAVWLTMTALS